MNKSCDVYYLSGPMTGYDKFNHPAFENAASILREIGLIVVSPHELVSLEDAERLSYEECFKIVLCGMTQCDVVVQMHNWNKSIGSIREAIAAKWSGMKIVNWCDLLIENGLGEKEGKE